MIRGFSALAQVGLARLGNALALVSAVFALGLVAGAALRPFLIGQGVPVAPAHADARIDEAAPTAPPIARRLDPGLAYPAEAIRIIDGDTFEARVRVWPGLDVDTKVRLRNIDAPELHARCADEHVKAEAARAALEAILAQGSITVSHVGVDKYGGRVDALVATRDTVDVSAALLNGGWARSYDGGKRAGWC